MVGGSRTALAIGACIFLFATGAMAAPSVEEAAAFARRELTRLCGDSRLSRFDQINDRTMFRTCTARASQKRVEIEVRFRAMEGDDPSRADAQRSGMVVTEVEFVRGSRFFCSPSEQKDRAGLYVSCESDIRFDGYACVKRAESVRRTNSRMESDVSRQSTAKLVELPQRDCTPVERALNYLAARSATRSGGGARDFFAKN